MKLTLRKAHPDDAEALSELIVQTLRKSNAKDYSPAVIEQVERSFTVQALGQLIGQRQVFVAVSGVQVVGTASLDGAVVRTVFVAPDAQGQGVGRRLMAMLEQVAIAAGIDVLTVPSSLTAEPFYCRLGFKTVREHFHGEERTLIMERAL